MSAQLQEVKHQILKDINQHTVKALDILINLWKETFEDNFWTANAEKLSEYVKTFYDDIIAETKTLQDKIKSDIKQLYSEASNLKQKLRVDLNLNPETDCPLYSAQKHLTDCLQILRDQLEYRQQKMNILLEEQKKLCIDLDEQPKELKNGSELPTEDDFIKFRQYLDNLIKEKHDRLNELNILRIGIRILLKKLDESLVNECDNTMLNDPSLPLTKKNLSNFNILRTNLQNRYNGMCEEIDKMKMELGKIWDLFDLDDNIKTQFDDIEYNQESYNKISRALKYWKQERRSNLTKFVINAREEIAYWLNKNLYSELEKVNISILNSDCFTEDLLTAHELELKNLIHFYHEHEKLFCLIEERQRYWDQMHALEVKAQEPGRYTNRGGQLLKEEKERKMISKRLPAIEKEIINLAENYEKSTNKKFTVYGIPVAELLGQDWRKMNEYKEIKFSRKKPTTPTKLKRQISTNKNMMKSLSTIVSSNENNRFLEPKDLLKNISAQKISSTKIPAANGHNENNRFHEPKHLLKNISAQKNLSTKIPVKLIYRIEHRRMTSNAFTSLESTILVPTMKSATLPSNPEKYFEFTKNTAKMTINNNNNINNYKLKNITNKINNRQNKQNNISSNVSNNNKNSDDQLSNILNNLMHVEFRLKNDQKVIRELLYEKDEIINRQWREILCIKAKYQDEDIENIQIDETSQYCPKCRRNYYGVDAAVPQTMDGFGYRERKISPSQSVEFASSSEEPEFNHQQHTKPNSFAGLRRNKKYISKKTTGTFTDYLKRRHHSYSPLPNNTPSIPTSDDQIEIKSILSQNTDVDSSYSHRINSLHGIKMMSSPVMTRSSGSSTTYEMIESGERKQNNKFIYDFEEKNENKTDFEVTDDWYASASDVEDSDNGMIKPYGYNAVNPVLECVNQILLQQSMDGIIENGTASPSPPPTKPLSVEPLNELPDKPPALPKSLPPTSHCSSQQKHQTLPRTNKRVHFSTQNSMVQVPRNKTTPPPPPPPPPPSSSTQSHNSNSSEKSMKNSSYDIQSIYSNEYEPIGGGSENTSVSSNYYIDMDSTGSMSKANSITNTECNRNLIDGPMSKVKLNPPDLPPKPPNLIKFKKLTKFNLNLNQNLVVTNGGGHSNVAAINSNNSGGNSNVNGSVSEPDYCSISEIHEIIVNNSQATGGSSSTSSKVNGLQHIQTVEAEVHKACDEYSISNNDDDSISVKSIIKLDDFNKNLLITNNGGNEQIQIQQTNDSSNNGHHDHDDDSDDLNDIPKLPNVAEIITPTKKEAARNISNILNNVSNNNNFMSINQDNYITKSIGELKFTNGSSTKLNGIINSATNKKLNSIFLKSPTSNSTNKINHQHPVIHDNNTINIIPTDKIPLIQAEFDWYNLDAEYGKSTQSGGPNTIPDVLTNNSGTNTNHGAAQNSDLAFLKLFDNCNIEPANNHVEYNLDDIEFNNNSANSATDSSASSTHSSSDGSNSGRINQPDIIKKIHEFENVNGPTANLLKFKTNYERFLNETALAHNGGMAGKPIILPRRKRVYYSGPFV